MSLLGIHFSHDSSFAFSPYPGEYRLFELERLTKRRYYSIDFSQLQNEKYNPEEVEKIIFNFSNLVEKEYGKEALNIEKVFADQMYPEVNGGPYTTSIPAHDDILNKFKKYFNLPEGGFTQKNHHLMHANSAFYQSPFEEALVFTYDAGGLVAGGDYAEFFCGYYFSREGEPLHLFSLPVHACSLYCSLPFVCKDIKANIQSSSGKAMGMSGYSGWSKKVYNALKPIFESQMWINCEVHSDGTGTLDNEYVYDIIKQQWGRDKDNKLDFWQGASFLATVQKLFEDTVIKNIEHTVYKYNLPIVLAGGGALNVLNNSRIKNQFKLPVFVPCNPNDTGTAIGAIFEEHKPKEQIDLRFNNWDLFDRDKLPSFVESRKGEKYSFKQISDLLREGKIIGVVRGRSECGPRALGNRSIICDPSIPDMKDVLNSKVKFREWYRPFAPMVLQDESSEYFNWDNTPAQNMNFSCITKSKYREKLKAVTHFDNTARIQTITKEDNPWYFDLLNEMKSSGLPVLLNTSFNIQGKPILNSIEDAFHVLDNTQLDYVIVEDYIFSK